MSLRHGTFAKCKYFPTISHTFSETFRVFRISEFPNLKALKSTQNYESLKTNKKALKYGGKVL